MNHTIVPRGKEGEEELIKVVSAIPGSNGKQGFKLHFPCLSAHIVRDDDDHATGYDVVTWSNYHERDVKVKGEVVKSYKNKPHSEGGPQRGENPGTFKVKRITMVPEMLCVKDQGSGRKMTYARASFQAGRDQLDYIEMAKRWGTSYSIAEGFSFGPNHPMQREEEIVAESSTLDGIMAELETRYGEFAETIITLFVGHELFDEYYEAEYRKAA